MASGLHYTSHGGAPELELGKLYEGSVVSTHMPTGRLVVKVDDVSQHIEDVIPAAGVLSSLLGFKTCYYPPPASRVLLLYGKTSYVVGYLPGPVLHTSQETRACTTGSEALDRNARKVYKVGEPLDEAFAKGHGVPNDILEGEFELSNLLGVGITLLTNLAKLAAGDMAKVEVLLLNDMVRIVSRNFKHVSSFGTTEIVDDGGKITCRVVGTSHEHEAWNRAKETDEKFEIDKGVVKLDKEIIKDVARWRYVKFLGYLGDFINEFVADPLETVGALAHSGKSRIYRGGDGTVLIQSVGEIALERVVRIPVPVELKRPEDPEGDISDAAINPEAIKFVRPWKHSRPDSLHHGVFQLRQYARWLSGLYSLARFHQHPKDWRVATETATPAPDKLGNHEEDRLAQVQGYPAEIDGYACIRIMRDGSVVVLAADGSSITMAGGNVQVAAARNLFLEAAGDVNIVAGRSVNIRARRNIELAATVGGLILKSRTWWRAICEQGSFRLRTQVNPAAELPAPSEDDPDPTPEVLPYGLVYEAPFAGIEVASNGAWDLRTRGDIKLSAGTLTATSLNDVALVSRIGFIKLKAAKSVLVAASAFLMRLTRGLFDINNKFTLRNHRLEVTAIAARTVISRLVMSESRKRGRDLHDNHVAAIPKDKINDEYYNPQLLGELDSDKDDDEGATYLAYTGTNLAASAETWDVEARNLGTLKPEELRPIEMSGSYTLADDIIESVTQQFLRLDNPAGDSYTIWNLGERLRINQTADAYAWPGDVLRWQASTDGNSLHRPLGTSYTELPNEATPLEKAQISMKVLKIIKP